MKRSALRVAGTISLAILPVGLFYVCFWAENEWHGFDSGGLVWWHLPTQILLAIATFASIMLFALCSAFMWGAE